MDFASIAAEEAMETVKRKKKRRVQDSGDANVLSLYLKEINRIPLLTREEEDHYARLAAQGDQHAKEKLVTANLRFVVNVAKKYQNQGLPLADLISEGNIGLLNAIERFDPDKGYHFISYAVWWIRQAILKAISEKSRMIRLPLNRANELVQIEKARKLVQTESGEHNEIKKVAETLDYDEDHVANLLNLSKEYVSLDTPVYEDRDSAMLGDYLKDEASRPPEDVVLEKTLQEEIQEVLATLTEKEAEIIQYRFGLNGRHPMSLKEIGDLYNLTKERIRQIEKKALKKIQQSEKAKILETYLAS
ncbi:RNA polymerase sigma-70 factor family protein [Spirochaeta thermophila DSM 6192]|uniref:RNA polymerase sigma factor n=2 Tax=Winmispira thermophila TaxID=154 RepID=E0RQ44_WINT6|nr:RNA polymerase sigma-70 factor family protein [Spirochaeta thermophila DSM 6192]